MALPISLCYILSFTAMLVYVTGKRFEDVSFLSVLLTAFMMYVTAFFGRLSYGFYLGVVLCGLFWVYFLIRRKDLDVFAKNYFTTGFFVFVFFAVFLYVLQRNRSFKFWDEYGHWGIMNRECLKLGTFYSVYDSRLVIHKDYPPLFVLIELVWACCNRLRYSEAMIYISLSTFSLMLLLPLFSKTGKNNVPKAFAALLSSVLLLIYVNRTPTASDGAHLLNSIYVDWTLSIFAAYVLYFIHTREEKHSLFDNLELTVLLSSLLMMKQIGIAFYALSVAYLFYRLLFVNRANAKELVSGAAASLLIPFLISRSWKMYIVSQNVARGSQFKISAVFETVQGLLFGGEALAWQKTAFTNFLNAILRRPLFVHPFPISYFPFVVITAVLLLVLAGVKRKNVELSVIYFLGSFGYAAMMLMLYVSSFGEIEGPPLASFDRYMIAYLYFGVCLLAYTVFSEEENTARCLALLLFLGLTFEYNDIYHLNPLVKDKKFVSGDNVVSELLDVDVPIGKRVLIINSQNTRDDLLYRLEYYQDWEYDILADEIFEMTEEYYVETLKEYDYLYLLHIDDAYVEKFWDTLTDAPVYDHGLYQISFENDILLIELVDNGQ
ncbi:MAG: hypothetical protein IKF18_05595 [Erysipelotrichaceae bacterium]|nr:hypothetical protein [Erysipelotrichaceae bacterium]